MGCGSPGTGYTGYLRHASTGNAGRRSFDQAGVQMPPGAQLPPPERCSIEHFKRASNPAHRARPAPVSTIVARSFRFAPSHRSGAGTPASGRL